jgi:hypothetical protein
LGVKRGEGEDKEEGGEGEEKAMFLITRLRANLNFTKNLPLRGGQENKLKFRHFQLLTPAMGYDGLLY